MRLNCALELLEGAEHGLAHHVPLFKTCSEELVLQLTVLDNHSLIDFFLLFLSIRFESQEPQRPYHRQFAHPFFSLAAQQSQQMSIKIN